jgi:membrane protease YdiL (CAAX protease family)
MIRIVVIDVVTFLIGFTMFFGSFSNIDYRISGEGITYGVVLIVLGILIRLWRKEFKEDNL